MKSKEEFIVANGLRHRALHWGSGDNLILICHGYLDSAATFAETAQQLAARNYHVIAFDWRGHGDSERIGAGGYYHFSDYVMDLDSLTRTLAVAPFHLIGHSMGGTVACLYAGVRTDKMRSLTLIEGLGPPEFSLDDLPSRMHAWLDGCDKARTRARHTMKDLREAAQRLQAWHSTLSDEVASVAAERLTRLNPEGPGLIWKYDPLHKTVGPYPFRVVDFSQYLQRISLEAHLIFGEKGMRLPDEAARMELIPKKTISTIPGAPHMMHWTHPKQLADTIALGLEMK